MIDKELNELEGKAKAATQGPWKVVEGFGGSFVYNKDGAQVSYNTTVTSIEPKHNISAKQARINSEYIAAASPFVIQELISELKQVRKERDWLASELEYNELCTKHINKDFCPDRNCTKCDQFHKEAWIKLVKESTCRKN